MKNGRSLSVENSAKAERGAVAQAVCGPSGVWPNYRLRPPSDIVVVRGI